MSFNTVDLSKDWDVVAENNVYAMNLLEDDSIDMIITSPPYDNARSYESGQTLT